MLLRDLTKVWISRAEETNDHGEYDNTWEYVSTAYLNMQQDINELDRKSTGEVDYSIYKARTTQKYNIKNGDGVSLSNIINKDNIVPEYRVLDQSIIGQTIVYRLEKYNG